MDESQNDYAKRKKSEPPSKKKKKDCMMSFIENQKADQWLPGAGRARRDTKGRITKEHDKI